MNPRASNWRPPETLPFKPHPVIPVLPRTNAPPVLIVICWAELEAKVPVVAPVLRVKSRPLINCAILVGFASKSVRLIVMVPAPVVKTAEAFTAPPLVILPDGVVSVMVFARAPEGIRPPNSNAMINKGLLMFRNLLAREDTAQIHSSSCTTVANLGLLKTNDLPFIKMQIIATS
jgi:hypothetical protein